MQRPLFAAALLIITGSALADQIGLSITIGQPGFYGRIDIGGAPAPQVIYPQPVIVQPTPELVSGPPLYLHVPPGHEKHWRQHCAEYDACGRRVYFVSHDWYRNVYVPRYQHDHSGKDGGGHHHGDHDQDHDHGHGHGRGHDRDDKGE